MLGKVLALLTQLKAAGVTAVIIAGAATVTVAGTSPEVQDTLHQLTNNIGLTQSTDCDHGQPAVVAQRNSADARLRAAYQNDHQALEALRGGKDADNNKVDSKLVGEVVKKYDDQLRDRLNTALNLVASHTLGRDGQNRDSDTTSTSGSSATTPTRTPTPTPTATPAGNAATQPSCTTATTVTTVTTVTTTNATPTPSANAAPESSTGGKPEQEGRVTVAERTTLDADLQTIVDTAITDMQTLVKTATAEAAKVPAPDHGKPSDTGKSADNPGNKPEDKGKPSGTPAHP